jgi:hypothetical protein
VADTARDTEKTMEDHLAASPIIAIGVGVLVGYMIGRSTKQLSVAATISEAARLALVCLRATSSPA